MRRPKGFSATSEVATSPPSSHPRTTGAPASCSPGSYSGPPRHDAIGVLVSTAGTRVAVEISSVPLMSGERGRGLRAVQGRPDDEPSATPASHPRQVEVLRLLEQGRSTGRSLPSSTSVPRRSGNASATSSAPSASDSRLKKRRPRRAGHHPANSPKRAATPQQSREHIADHVWVRVIETREGSGDKVRRQGTRLEHERKLLAVWATCPEGLKRLEPASSARVSMHEDRAARHRRRGTPLEEGAHRPGALGERGTSPAG